MLIISFKFGSVNICTYINTMKNIAYVFALAIGLASCTKEPAQEGNKVVYTVKCDSCVLIADMLNHPARAVEVRGFYQRAEINKLASITIRTIGTGKISSSIRVNDKVAHQEDNVQNGDTVSYTVKP